jgi:hypothetical protein
MQTLHHFFVRGLDIRGFWNLQVSWSQSSGIQRMTVFIIPFTCWPRSSDKHSNRKQNYFQIFEKSVYVCV